jgi:hypothetical protein
MWDYRMHKQHMLSPVPELQVYWDTDMASHVKFCDVFKSINGQIEDDATDNNSRWCVEYEPGYVPTQYQKESRFRRSQLYPCSYKGVQIHREYKLDVSVMKDIFYDRPCVILLSYLCD